MRNYYVAGDWNAICQRCGFKHKASELKLDWKGLRVCSECFETRHPLDLIQVPTDTEAAPWVSPEASDLFVTPGEFILAENDNGDGDPSFMLRTETGAILTTET